MLMKFKKAMLLCVALFSYLGMARADLVSHWPLDGDANDIVGNHDGAVSGGVAFGAKGAVVPLSLIHICQPTRQAEIACGLFWV